MKYVLILGLLIATSSCSSGKLWMVGYDEDKARTLCQGITPKNDITYVSQPPPTYQTRVVTPKPTEHVERAVTQCVAQSRQNALGATVPVVFTVPLVR